MQRSVRCRASGGLAPGAAMCIALVTAGCQSYSPQPPDLAGHYEKWLQRSPKDAALHSYAASLDAADDAQANQRRLTRTHAEQLAMQFNAQLRQARARAGVSQARADHAGLLDDPVLNLGVERILAGVDHPWETMNSISFTLPTSGSLAYEQRQADAAHRAQLFRVFEQEWQVLTDVRTTWIAWSAAQERVHVTQTYLQQLREIVNIIQRMEDVGELARVQAGLFYIELHTRLNDLARLEAQVRDRSYELRKLMGFAPHGEVDPLDDATPSFAFANPGVELSQAARLSRELHPRVLVRQAEHDAAERVLALEIRRQYPDIVLGPGYGNKGGNSRLLMGFSLPLMVFNRNRQAIAEAQAQRSLAEQSLETAFEGLVNDYAVADNEREAVAEQIARMNEMLIPLVDQQYADARSVAELGEVDTVLLLDTLRRQYETKMNLIDLHARQSRLHVQMRALLGPELSQQAEQSAENAMEVLP